ncbi:hypothetical protein GCM10027090_21250 [Sinomonas soli]
MGHHQDAGPGFGELLDHGQGGADASVVGDGGTVERHVQIRTDQNVPPTDTIGEQVVESACSHGLRLSEFFVRYGAGQSLDATSSVRSTRRFE